MDNNLGFRVNSKKELFSFKGVSSFNENPSNIEYLILDVNNSNVLNDTLIQQIYNLKIKYLQIRFSEALDFDETVKLIFKLNLFNSSNVNEISIVVKYNFQLSSFIKEAHNTISNKFLNFILHSSETEDFQTFGSTSLTSIKSEIKIPLSCG